MLTQVQRLKRLQLDVSPQSAFHAGQFAHPRLPVVVGKIRNQSGFDTILPCCLDMLIKLPRGEIRLPSPYATHTAVNDLLEQILAFEQQLLGDDWEDYHLYLTVDCRSVPAGHTQRNPGWHFDGMQGVRYPKKLPICHQYVVSNSIPTEYAGAPLDAGGLDERKDNWFEVLGGMLPEDGLRELGQPYRIEAMSAYQLHRASVAEETAQRMFMRLDFSLKQQDRLGNTRNPLLAAPWVFVGRTSLGASLPTETGFNRSGRYGA